MSASSPGGSNRRPRFLAIGLGAAVFWMGIYPESFIRPMRNDVGRLLTRLERVAPAGDSHLTLGKGAAAETHSRSAERSCRRTQSGPWGMSARAAVGENPITVTRWRAATGGHRGACTRRVG